MKRNRRTRMLRARGQTEEVQHSLSWSRLSVEKSGYSCRGPLVTVAPQSGRMRAAPKRSGGLAHLCYEKAALRRATKTRLVEKLSVAVVSVLPYLSLQHLSGTKPSGVLSKFTATYSWPLLGGFTPEVENSTTRRSSDAGFQHGRALESCLLLCPLTPPPS